MQRTPGRGKVSLDTLDIDDEPHAARDGTNNASAAALPPHVRAVPHARRRGIPGGRVGGAVRDALLGRTPGDWDVATSAHPEQVMALFKHTVPTGLGPYDGQADIAKRRLRAVGPTD